MDLETHNMCGKSVATFMARDGLHHRWLTHDDSRTFRHHIPHRYDHWWRTCTTNFFIKAKSQLQWPGHLCVMRLDQSPDSQRIKTLHVTSATPIIPAVFFNHCPRIRFPRLAINGHNICMPRQYNSALNLRADMRKQCRLVGLIRIRPTM